MLKPITLLTIVHNRERALFNQLDAVGLSSVLPKEVIVVRMNEEILPLPPHPYPIRQISLHTKDGLNLAAARNYALQYSHSEKNVFLDVDCIPAPTLIEEYLNALEGEDRLVSGRVRYLSSDETASLDLSKNLFKHSEADPIRPENKDYTHETYWTLNFGCTKRTFYHIGGFDETYTGYGAEDTDFAFEARKQGIDVLTIDATVFHQYHPSYSPPLNHLEDILKNANVFYKKWGEWPMEGWLKAFEQRGYIHCSKSGTTLLRRPTNEEIDATLKK